MKGKNWQRYTLESLEKNEQFEKGNIYFSDKHGQANGTQDYLICGAVCDTYKQIFKGTIDHFLDDAFKALTQDGETYIYKDEINNTSAIRYRRMTIPCDLKVKRMGKNARYRYSLQNSELGVYILLGSYFQKIDVEFSHLKIELSPHFIAKRTPKQIDEFLSSVADMLLEEPEATEPEVHLAVDVQGWELPAHMIDNMVTRAKRIQSYDGISSIEFDTIAECAISYGRAESLTLGSRSSLQSSFYRKDLQMLKVDQVDYYHEKWGEYTLGSYDPEKSVTRIEFRFHQSVIKQFSTGLDKPLTTYSQLCKYFTNLWKYALNANRYMYDKEYVHPVWQMFYEDIVFTCEEQPIEFKRVQAKTDTTAISRQIANALGNLITMYSSRTTLTPEEIAKKIYQADFFPIIESHLKDRNMRVPIFLNHIVEKVRDRRTCGKYALTA